MQNSSTFQTYALRQTKECSVWKDIILELKYPRRNVKKTQTHKIPIERQWKIFKVVAVSYPPSFETLIRIFTVVINQLNESGENFLIIIAIIIMISLNILSLLLACRGNQCGTSREQGAGSREHVGCSSEQGEEA
eukprot:755385-Hanusia_phi.AAC.6